MKWFERGRLWRSPDEAREGRDERDSSRSRGDGDEAARGRDWRPGGAHRDPRQKFIDAKKARNTDRRKERFERRQRAGTDNRGPEQEPRPQRREPAQEWRNRPPQGNAAKPPRFSPSSSSKSGGQRPHSGGRDSRGGPDRHDAPRPPRTDGRTGQSWRTAGQAGVAVAVRHPGSRPPKSEWQSRYEEGGARPSRSGNRALTGARVRPNQSGSRGPSRAHARPSPNGSPGTKGGASGQAEVATERQSRPASAQIGVAVAVRAWLTPAQAQMAAPGRRGGASGQAEVAAERRPWPASAQIRVAARSEPGPRPQRPEWRNRPRDSQSRNEQWNDRKKTGSNEPRQEGFGSGERRPPRDRDAGGSRGPKPGDGATSPGRQRLHFAKAPADRGAKPRVRMRPGKGSRKDGRPRGVIMTSQGRLPRQSPGASPARRAASQLRSFGVRATPVRRRAVVAATAARSQPRTTSERESRTIATTAPE